MLTFIAVALFMWVASWLGITWIARHSKEIEQ